MIHINATSKVDWTHINPVGATSITEDQSASVETVDMDGEMVEIVVVNDMGIVKVYRDGVQMFIPTF